MDILKAYKAGITELQRKHDEAEVGKLGTFRAGNSGLYSEETKEWFGPCARIVYLRHKGIGVDKPEESREHMFAAGRGNEDIWAAMFTAAGVPFLREEDIPTSWFTRNGTKVTGRPDMVLGTKHIEDVEHTEHDGHISLVPTEVFTPTRGLELKLVSSVWTARDVLFQGSPKLIHLAQATHYSWQVGVPFEIWYASRADWPVVGWMQKNFPSADSPLAKYCEYNEKGEIKKVKPFIVGYELRLEDGVVCYRQLQEDGTKSGWTKSIVSVARIEAFYNELAGLEKKNELPPEPLNTDAKGELANWKASGYCALKGTGLCCAERKTGKLDKWFEEVSTLHTKGDIK
jgi:hypothetical protein